MSMVQLLVTVAHFRPVSEPQVHGQSRAEVCVSGKPCCPSDAVAKGFGHPVEDHGPGNHFSAAWNVQQSVWIACQSRWTGCRSRTILDKSAPPFILQPLSMSGACARLRCDQLASGHKWSAQWGLGHVRAQPPHAGNASRADLQQPVSPLVQKCAAPPPPPPRSCPL